MSQYVTMCHDMSRGEIMCHNMSQYVPDVIDHQPIALGGNDLRQA